jgi:ribonuclease HI
VAVQGCTGDPPLGGAAIAELFGPVELDPSSPHYLFAKVGSNNTGELSAICEALRWLLHSAPASQPAVICYDSECACEPCA